MVQPYHPIFLRQLTELANRQIRSIPPHWQFNPEEAAEILFTPSLIAAHHYEDFLPSDFEIQTLCLARGQTLLASAQVFLPRKPRLPGPAAIAPYAVISWLVAREGVEPQALVPLLEALAGCSRAAGCVKLAFTRSGLGAGWVGVCEEWGEICAALETAGFRRTARWVILSGSTDVPDLGSIDRLGPFGVARMPDQSCGEWRIRAYAKDFIAGETEAWAIPERFARLPAAAGWVTIEWLSVDPRYRQRGLGRWIFSELLRWQHEMFNDYAVFWATDDNQAMLRLARSLGFKEGPATLEYELDL